MEDLISTGNGSLDCLGSLESIDFNFFSVLNLLLSNGSIGYGKDGNKEESGKNEAV